MRYYSVRPPCVVALLLFLGWLRWNWIWRLLEVNQSRPPGAAHLRPSCPARPLKSRTQSRLPQQPSRLQLPPNKILHHCCTFSPLPILINHQSDVSPSFPPSSYVFVGFLLTRFFFSLNGFDYRFSVSRIRFKNHITVSKNHSWVSFDGD